MKGREESSRFHFCHLLIETASVCPWERTQSLATNWWPNSLLSGTRKSLVRQEILFEIIHFGRWWLSPARSPKYKQQLHCHTSTNGAQSLSVQQWWPFNLCSRPPLVCLNHAILRDRLQWMHYGLTLNSIALFVSLNFLWMGIICHNKQALVTLPLHCYYVCVQDWDLLPMCYMHYHWIDLIIDTWSDDVLKQHQLLKLELHSIIWNSIIDY